MDSVIYRRTENVIEKSSLKEMVMFLLFAIFVVLISTPYIMSYHAIVPFALSLVLLAITFKSFLTELLKGKIFLFIFLFFALEVTYFLLGYSNASIGNYLIKFILLIACWIVFYIKKNFSSSLSERLLLVTYTVAFVNIIIHIHLFNTIPLLNSELMYTGQWGKLNIGSYGFKYGILFLSLSSLACVKISTFSKIKRLFLIIFYIISSIYILFYSASATIVISHLLSSMCLFLFISKNKTQHSLLTILFVLIIIFTFVFVTFFPNKIVDLAYQIFGNKIGDRFNAIFELSSDGFSGGSGGVLARFSFIKLDLDFFVDTPITFIFGNGFHTGASNTVAEFTLSNKAGGHSEIFDSIARYGLFGVSFVIIYVYNLIKLCKNQTNKNLKKIGIILSIVFILNGVLNSFFHPYCIFVFCFCMDYFCGGLNGRYNKQTKL